MTRVDCIKSAVKQLVCCGLKDQFDRRAPIEPLVRSQAKRHGPWPGSRWSGVNRGAIDATEDKLIFARTEPRKRENLTCAVIDGMRYTLGS